jgi:hypothetical protein
MRAYAIAHQRATTRQKKSHELRPPCGRIVAQKKFPPAPAAPVREDYFCQVRFLWRFAFRRFRRLCFDILRARFLRRFPMGS